MAVHIDVAPVLDKEKLQAILAELDQEVRDTVRNAIREELAAIKVGPKPPPSDRPHTEIDSVFGRKRCGNPILARFRRIWP